MKNDGLKVMIYFQVTLSECLLKWLFFFFVRRGSVIGTFLVEYQYLDGYQIVDFVDQVTEDMQVGEMYIGKYDVINLSGKSQTLQQIYFNQN